MPALSGNEEADALVHHVEGKIGKSQGKYLEQDRNHFWTGQDLPEAGK